MSDTGDGALIERLAIHREEAELCADAAAFDIAEKAAQTCKHNPGCECEWNDDGEVQICQPMYEFALIRIYKHILEEREIIRKASQPHTQEQADETGQHSQKSDLAITRR